MNMIRRFVFILLLFAVALSVFPAFAGEEPAAVRDDGILNMTYDMVEQSAKQWVDKLQKVGKSLFLALFLISFVWKLGQHLLTGNHNISGFFFELLNMIIFGGFWYWHLNEGHKIFNDIVLSFYQLGGGSASSGKMDAGNLMWTVLDVCSDIVKAAMGAGPVDVVLMTVVSLAMMGVAAIVCANLLVLMCTAQILCYGGMFYFGFAGSPWTSEIAKNYYKSVLGIAVNIYATLLLVKIGSGTFVEFSQQLVTQEAEGASAYKSFQTLIALAVAAVVMGLVIMKIPPMLAGIVNAPTGSMAPSIGMMAAGQFAVGAFRKAGNAAAAVQGARAQMAQDNKTRAAEGKAETTSLGGKTLEVAKNLASASWQNFREGSAKGGIAKILEDKVTKSASKERDLNNEKESKDKSKSAYASSVPDAGSSGGSGAGQNAGSGGAMQSGGNAGSGGGSGAGQGSGGNAIGGGSGAGQSEAAASLA